MKHLTCADYRTMPWANGKGTTVELLRVDGPQGLLWRLSMASVVEDGPFSMLPGIDRNLTVVTGPGFRLNGPGVDLTCAPLVPVSFPGDVAVTALDVTAPSDDFNVMTDRACRIRPLRWNGMPACPQAARWRCLRWQMPGSTAQPLPAMT
jgi:environmental stress-induced protein Ves